ncbi:MAG TPA: GNAT family N-acetyltransferase [Ferruginibacter sp.]|nr:GNAT family N-acetyltransferase [Ferruginibacter sp.]HRN79243.1 GNAT family N-acetyltransferase [Ferruginibacter sp.]HRO17171.1 GNAT family N-acetyltransferase [Ferruginibacter sp.]HRQ20363.1 GNAT family N-acetyltransferase [Ferruginibacter sp.]
MDATVQTHCLPFHSLNTNQLYQILRARQEVFIIEQDCNYLDCDGRDLPGEHLWISYNNELAAYARLLPPGVAYAGSSIGRVLTTKPYRGKGFGKQLMERAIHLLETQYPQSAIYISAQQYLEKFYSDLGFVSTGESYLEDDIPHIKMIRPVQPHGNI